MTKEEFLYKVNIINANEKRVFEGLRFFVPDCDMWFTCYSTDGMFHIRGLISEYLKK